MNARIFYLLLKVLLSGNLILAYPQFNTLNSDISSVSALDVTDSDISSTLTSGTTDARDSNISTASKLDANDSSFIPASGPKDSNISSIPTSSPTDSDVSSTSTSDSIDSGVSAVPISEPTSVENQDKCEASTENIDSSSTESENILSQNDPSGSASPNVIDINKRLVDSTKDSELSSSTACPAQYDQQTNPPTSHTNAKPTKNGSDDDCRIDPKTKRCEVAIATLVYARTCKATSNNDLVTLELIKMIGSAAGVYLSKIKGCGVFFWYAKLKPSQVARLAKFKAVRGIAPNGKIDHHGTLGKQVSVGEAAQTNSRHRLRKRDTVVTRVNHAGDLAHISSAPGRRSDHRTYRYFRSAGQATIRGRQHRTVAYVLGEGVNEKNAEIRPTSINWWLYGMGVNRRETIEATNRHLTTCLISKIIGISNGVANQAEVVMVKILDEIGSFIDGLVQIISDVKSHDRDAAGFTVVSISHSWKRGSISEMNLYGVKKLLKILESLGVVIVCSSGKNDRFPEGEDNNSAYRQVSSYPALWSQEPDMSIIAVGSIQQYSEQTPYWSPVGDAVTVSAPGFCVCATSHPGYDNVEALGTEISSSIVTGLVLAFAALDDVGPKLRAYQNIPKAFKEYLVRKAYVRRGGTALSVWNGLSAEISDQWIPDADNLVENDAPPGEGDY